ncbi:hypothetical protein DFR49_4369 [Hephaestia caeni]|uniref:Oligosaccharide repeat unit polymerase n=1 Tax=Hephaestia caeni TaxID=645617 RepID=A0A397NPF3_9SPHN|nr:hypothetical protein [Hephaestia caeni]RIA35351.1 hypothetical protein DFR49_4369 [Hephaestia caeni]
MILYALCILTYFGPIFALRASKAPLISPLTFAVIFYFTQFGPQALFHSFLRVAYNPSTLHDHRFVLALAIANVTIALGIFFGRMLVKIPQTSTGNLIHAPLLRTRRGLPFLLATATVYGMIFILLDGPGAPRLRENLLFLFNGSVYSYTEIRRILFADALVSTVQEYTRQFTTALLIAFLAISSIRTRGSWRISLAVAAFFVFTTAAMQLNKFPILYTMASCTISCYVFKARSFNLSFRGKFYVIIQIIAMLAALFFMYVIQYSEQVSRGILGTDNFISMIFYRPFMAESDALRLWFVEFPDKTPFLGLRNVSLFSSIFGWEFFDVTRHIPHVYINNDLTSFQTGFIGSGYSSFGYIGVAIYGLIVGMIGAFSTSLLFYIRELDVKSAFCGVLCMNMYFLFSRELSTASLSGGVFPVIFAGLGYIIFLNRKRSRSREEFRNRNLSRLSEPKGEY